MKQAVAALIAGIIFGLGLAVSQMINPAKVLGFLDVAGRWDPSLAFVMAGALIVSFIGFRLSRLIGGAVIFGIGWGLVGICPGPLFASLAFGMKESLVFAAAMTLGAWLQHKINRMNTGPVPLPPR